MKLAAIAKLIKSESVCHLYRVHGDEDTETSVYIGTNSTVFSLEGFPKPWTEPELMTLLGMEKKQWDGVHYKEYLENNETNLCGVNMEDVVQDEVRCKTHSIGLNLYGSLLMGLVDEDSKQIGFISISKLAPIADEIRKSEYIAYFQRRMPNGKRYYVVKDGMMVRGAFMPVELSNSILQTLDTMVKMAQKTALLDGVEG